MFPDAQLGDTTSRIRAGIGDASEAPATVPRSRSTAPPSTTIADHLRGLSDLHTITADEFETAKTQLLQAH